MSASRVRVIGSSGVLAAVIAALAISHAAPARADDPASIRQANRDVVVGFAARLREVGTGQFVYVTDDPALCRAAIKDGTAAGLKPTDTFDGAAGPVLWKNAAGVCDEYARVFPLRAVIDAVGQQVALVNNLRTTSGFSGDGLRAQAGAMAACAATIDKALAAGAPADVKFSPQHNANDERVTLTEARARCAEFAKFGEGEAKNLDAAAAAELKVIHDKYAKLGITGDRLKYLTQYDDHIILGKNCKELSLKAKKTSAVFYEVSEDDAKWTVYKTQYKKDKQVKYSSRDYSKLTSQWKCW